MKKVAEIESNDALEPGRYYHCFDRETIAHSIQKCKAGSSAPNQLGGLWADDDNSQALNNWRVFGPIDPPNVGGIYLCSAHGGYGFQSDCLRCKILSKD